MQLPGPIRAAIGLLASAADETRRLPDRAIELPMLAVSTALQASLRAQQRYARLAARGDAVLNRQPRSDEPPPWARFDDPLSTAEATRPATRPATPPATPPAMDPVTAQDGAAGPASPPEFGSGELATQLMAELFDDAEATGPESAQFSDGSGAVEDRRTPARGKSVSKPRHIPPSAFDTADESTPDEHAADEHAAGDGPAGDGPAGEPAEPAEPPTAG